VYWGLKWWAWAGIGLLFIVVTLMLARVVFRAFVRVGELTDALGRARDELDGAMGVVRDESEEARGRLESLRERSKETGPPAANPFAR
jgi:membrane protein implicated in regulation of membrane protease activity